MKYFSVMRYTGDNIPSGEEQIIGNQGITVEESTEQVDFSGLQTNTVLSIREIGLISQQSGWFLKKRNGTATITFLRLPPFITATVSEAFRKNMRRC
ncbi:MAG: hypothetical protein MR567_07835 [Oscillospiraceae bacterium]|nr:hypothetical protein [Oscillospiraceae bacterium]